MGIGDEDEKSCPWKIQLAIHFHGLCIYRSNQLIFHWTILRNKIPGSFKKQNLNLLCTGNYLHIFTLHLPCTYILFSQDQFSSVAQSCPTLCNPMDCSTPGFPVHHQLQELTQNVHRVGDAIQSFHPVIPFSSCLQSFPASEAFPLSWLFTSGGQSIGASASVLPVSIQCWFPLELTGLICHSSPRVRNILGKEDSGACVNPRRASINFCLKFESHLSLLFELGKLTWGKIIFSNEVPRTCLTSLETFDFHS